MERWEGGGANNLNYVGNEGLHFGCRDAQIDSATKKEGDLSS